MICDAFCSTLWTLSPAAPDDAFVGLVELVDPLAPHPASESACLTYCVLPARIAGKLELLAVVSFSTTGLPRTTSRQEPTL
jgi:hypothetical protein